MPGSESLGTQIWLCLSALAAGAINSIAGGGTLLTFPALTAVVPYEVANATSTVALVPGSAAGAWGYRREFAAIRRWALILAGPSLVGGYVGTRLVIAFPDAFQILVPWLILTAALLFLLQPTLSRFTRGGQKHGPPSTGAWVGVIAFQFLVAVYGGYFGAGIGILMITSLSLMGAGHIHETNALKTFLAACINGVSVVVWVAYDKVRWDLAPGMAVAAIVGGYLGAHFARRLPKALVRGIVIAIGFGLAAYYFYKQVAA
ncbi:MAG TPA: sulfite exporter TauE/SafE family protein [Gemmataceae bacterium]|nr:sulfite exporter TauE/SafE family protein [Gemmataceae bacterium]